MVFVVMQILTMVVEIYDGAYSFKPVNAFGNKYKPWFSELVVYQFSMLPQ